ncbi:MAG: cyclic nucleotide-binding domain-containing protein [Candidatus Methylomirabilales bacterium]
MSRTALSTGEKLRTLEACRVFAGVPAAERAVLAEMMRTEHVAAGELLFEAGEPSDCIYVVAAGALDVLLPGEAAPVRRLLPGDLLGEYGLLTEGARTATVRAPADALLLSLDYRRFRAFLLRYPEATLVLLKTAVARLVAAEGGRRLDS